MPNAGIIASAIVTGAAVDVLFEDFANFTDAPWATTAGAPSIVAARTGNGAQLKSSDRISYTIPAISESSTVTVGFAMRCATALSGTAVLFLRSDAGATDHISIRVETTGSLSIRAGGLPIGGTAPAATIPVNTWKYVEVQSLLLDTVGSVTVRVDGTPVITSTGIDTKVGGTKTTYDQVRLQGNHSTNNTLFDDLYITTGAAAAFKGDITI